MQTLQIKAKAKRKKRSPIQWHIEKAKIEVDGIPYWCSRGLSASKRPIEISDLKSGGNIRPNSLNMFKQRDPAATLRLYALKLKLSKRMTSFEDIPVTTTT